MDAFHIKREYLPVTIAIVVIAIVLGVYYFTSPRISNTNNSSMSASDEEKMLLLQQLEAQGSSTSGASKRKTLDSLSNQSGSYQYSEQGKLQILESLQNQK